MVTEKQKRNAVRDQLQRNFSCNRVAKYNQVAKYNPGCQSPGGSNFPFGLGFYWRLFSLFLGPFLGAKKSPFLTPFAQPNQRENYHQVVIWWVFT